VDYSKYLVLYSGGADSTHFVETEPTAKYLLHYAGRNKTQSKVAIANANILNRYITIVEASPELPGHDGETNQIHALYDTRMVIDAGIKAVSHGMSGVVVCFNKDDIGIDTKSIEAIFRRAEPGFQVLTPLIAIGAAEIRANRVASTLKSVSCMVDEHCGHCAKCLKTY